MSNKQLYIGLNGFAGSGKDTVAKMIKTILNYDWKSLDECKEWYNSIYVNPTISATHNNPVSDIDKPVICIAFADQLKTICSTIFGIPVERFYQNKSTAWVCINDDFHYTEVKPDESHILTADDYYNNINEYKDSSVRYYLSLREILVYVGTYVLQQDINKRIFVNVVRNTIQQVARDNKFLKYVIVTDIRFQHEIDYIHGKNGITITITRDDVQQLDNVAEHELDYVEDWDYTIENNGTYDDLFEQVWNILHDNIEFSNITVDLNTRDDVNNYLRLIYRDNDITKYKLCSPYSVVKIFKSNGDISMLDPLGGPILTVGDYLQTTPINESSMITDISMDVNTNKFIITCEEKWNQ